MRLNRLLFPPRRRGAFPLGTINRAPRDAGTISPAARRCQLLRKLAAEELPGRQPLPRRPKNRGLLLPASTQENYYSPDGEGGHKARLPNFLPVGIATKAAIALDPCPRTRRKADRGRWARTTATARQLEGLVRPGVVVPAYAVLNHINFDGRPTFYPGNSTPRRPFLFPDRRSRALETHRGPRSARSYYPPSTKKPTGSRRRIWRRDSWSQATSKARTPRTGASAMPSLRAGSSFFPRS